MTAGTGHRRAAEALTGAVGERYRDAEIRCLDVLTCTPAWFRALYTWSYLFLVRRLPWVWEVSYGFLDGGAGYRIVQPFRRLWNLLITRRFAALLRETRPELIVTTHFLPADVCSAAKAAGWLTAPLVVVITDLFPHRFWISPQAEAIVVGTDEGAAVLARRGVARERVHVKGIPIGKAFGVPADRTALRARLGVPADRRTVLVTSGGTTVGQFERVVMRLEALGETLPQSLHLLIVCGEDDQARRRLAARAERGAVPMQVFGFIDHMADLMAASDLIVTKAGGLTVCEALGSGVPLILYHVIPGQERLNAAYVARHGAGVVAQRPAGVARAVARCVREPEWLATMTEAARALGHPDAAAAIASEVVGPLLSRGGGRADG